MLMVESMQLADTGAAQLSTMAGKRSSSDWVDARHPAKVARLDIFDIKDQIVKCVGRECAERYFLYFRGFINARLSKKELDKFVVHTIGQENVRLHNQLVKAILSNAVNAEAPPPTPKDVSKLVTSDQMRSLVHSKVNDGVPPHTYPTKRGSSSCTVRPCECDSRSNKGADSEIEAQKTCCEPDLFRPMQCLEGAANELATESSMPPIKHLRVLHPASIEVVRPFETANQDICRVQESGHLRTQLGTRLCDGSGSDARRATCLAFPLWLLMQEAGKDDHLDAVELLDNESLWRQMEQIALLEGLEGVNVECATLLNDALDHFLRRLIKACVDVVRHRQVSQQQSLQDTFLVQEKGIEIDDLPISIRDFKVVMDLNPEQLGEHWPVQLEKLALRLLNYESSSNGTACLIKDLGQADILSMYKFEDRFI